jgi:hypothetical protein
MLGSMTATEQLQELVEILDDKQADRALSVR